ncbi:MAG: secretin N-terminal domain-containing protein [Planctomycetota bacterium]|jgi:hypothetical protein
MLIARHWMTNAVCWPVLAIALAGLVPSATAQFAEDDQNPTITRTIELQHVHPRSVVASISALGLPLAADQVSDTHVVLRGRDKDIESFTKEILPQLDRPGDNVIVPEPLFIRLSQLDARVLVDMIMNIRQSDRTRAAIDKKSGTVVVRGTKRDLAMVRQLVEEIDRPAASLTAHFYFIRGTIGASGDEGAASLPAKLAGVAKAMKENGFGNLNLLSIMIVSVNEGKVFEQQSHHHLADGEHIRESLDLTIEGRAGLDTANGIAHLDIAAAIRGDYSTLEDGGETAFEVDTSIAAKLGGYAILAAGPGASVGGNALAVVVHVTNK